MSTALITHEAGLDHRNPPGHPERPDRLRALDAVFARPGFARLTRVPARRAARDELLRAHPAAYLDALEAASPAQGFAAIDGDTGMSPGSLAAARRAAGGACMAVDMVMRGDAANAFVACRPPGHHAERVRAMGFCLLSNAAIAVLHALDGHGLRRVALADFDVHHGNGSQNILWEDPRAAFCSSHEMPLYPGSGAESERGAGNVFNGPLRAGDGGAAFRAVWEDRLLPAIAAHAPELIVISAGFDAHRLDPLANLELEAEDFAWITERLCDIAGDHARGRVVSTLEGGYDLEGLASGAAAHLEVLAARGRGES